jgi:2-polyprenyl-3-methyl-5-hydroxy-6-metoxy-1,4-benzoquinol methylase
MKAFDEPASLRINAARAAFLRQFLEELRRTRKVATAADVGCGFGFFSGVLLEAGLDVTAIDGRAENVREAQNRHPGLETAVFDVEDRALAEAGRFDLVLCYGLLYHLENPFAAIRNLAALTGGVALIESVRAPGDEPATVMYEEDHDIDQALNYIAMIPTESFLIKALYAAGLEHVYRTTAPPEHHDFRDRVVKRRRRTVLVASREPLALGSLVRADEPRTRRYIWDPFGRVLESERLRAALRRGVGALGSGRQAG